MTLLEAKEITVSYYGDIEILKDVSLNVKKGQITSIIGPNGAGKSTLLKSLYGLLKPKKGRVLLNNMDITKRKVHEFIGLGITYVPQLRSIFPDLSVEENLQLGTWIFKKDATRVKESIEKVYTRFPILFKKKADKAGLLSGGQQKILEIGRSLLTDPEICLFDEPTATLAPRIAEEIYSTILDLKNENITIVMVDQRIKQAFDISDQIYVLELGKNKANGTREDFEGGLKE
ncbi:MAG: ABC transporter ATP-binding protein, partial [Desulfobacula sp.]|nr:ABC transporter ATP-binding protein [Desulfobacula sp.]